MAFRGQPKGPFWREGSSQTVVSKKWGHSQFWRDVFMYSGGSGASTPPVPKSSGSGLPWTGGSIPSRSWSANWRVPLGQTVVGGDYKPMSSSQNASARMSCRKCWWSLHVLTSCKCRIWVELKSSSWVSSNLKKKVHKTQHLPTGSKTALRGSGCLPAGQVQRCLSCGHIGVQPVWCGSN